MNSVLFAIVTALAVYQVFACKVTVLRVGSVSVSVAITIEDHNVETNFETSLGTLTLNTSYYEDNTWKALQNINLCDDDAQYAVFKKIFFDVLSLESCTTIDEGDYVGKTEILYPDEVCTEVSEKTNGNYKKLPMELSSVGMTIFAITIKVED